MRIVFMGTPDFARGALEEIIGEGYEVVLVVTQPDRPQGRSGKLVASPVKECAEKHGIPVFQPEKIRLPEAVEKVREYDADLFIVAAFGQILTKEILDMPRLGCVNIHASLLPKYRGAAPIQWAIINGDEYTGVTIMKMAEGVDTGDILTSEKVKICDDDTADSLFDKLCKCGAKLMARTIPLIENGSLTSVPQDESKATHVSKITKEMGEIDFTKKACEIERLVRGLNSWPSAYTFLEGKQLKIWEASVCEKEGRSGEILCIDKDSFTVGTGEGSLKVLQLQLEGKKRMSTHDFLLGAGLSEGLILGR